MGSGGVAIAALPTVIYLEVPFSDGLGGGNSCYCRSHKRTGAIIEHVITQILLHSGCKNIKKIYTAVTFYNFFFAGRLGGVRAIVYSQRSTGSL